MNKEVKDFEHGLDSALMNSVDTPELEVSSVEADAIPISVSSAFLCLVNTHSDNYKLQPAFSIKCHTLWCQTWAFPLPVLQVPKSQPVILFVIFLSSSNVDTSLRSI